MTDNNERKKTARDIGTIAGIGIGLGVINKVEAVAKPPIPVVGPVAPIVGVGATVVGAGLVLRGLDKLSMVRPQRLVQIRSLKKAKKVINEPRRLRFM